MNLSWVKTLNNDMLYVVNKWWRPVGYATLIGGMAANTILIPFLTKKGVSLHELGGLMLCFAPLAGLRTYEKMKDPNDPLGQDPQGPNKNESDQN